MADHSPLPWGVAQWASGRTFIVDETGANVLFPHAVQPVAANAAFICRAVNSYHELLAALKAVSWETTLLEVWLAEQSQHHALTPAHERWIRDRVTRLRTATDKFRDRFDGQEATHGHSVG